MGGFGSALVRGGIDVLRAARLGEQERAELERQARREALLSRMNREQLADILARRRRTVEQEQREAGERAQTATALRQDAAAARKLDPRLADASDQAAAAALPKLLEQRQKTFHFGGGRAYGFNPETGEIQPGPEPEPEVTEPKEYQGRLLRWGSRMAEAARAMEQLEAKYRGIGQRVDAKLRVAQSVEMIPGAGQAFGPAALAVVTKGMTEPEQVYAGHALDLLNARLRAATGAALNMREYGREAAPYLATAGDSDQALASKQERRKREAYGFLKTGGAKLAPDFLEEGTWDWLQAGRGAKPKAAGTYDKFLGRP